MKKLRSFALTLLDPIVGLFSQEVQAEVKQEKAVLHRERQLQRAIRLEDERNFDSRGNVVKLEPQGATVKLEEPYDPAYLKGEVTYETKIKDAERVYINKTGTLQNALRKARIPYIWTRRAFVIEIIKDGFRHERVLHVDWHTNQYNFGTYDIVLHSTQRVLEIVQLATEFLEEGDN